MSACVESILVCANRHEHWSSEALKNAADAAIENFDAMLADEIAKDPSAGTLFPPV